MNKLTKLLSIFAVAGAIGAGVAGIAGCTEKEEGGNNGDNGGTPTVTHQGILQQGKAPTCTEDGTENYYICNDAGLEGKKFSDAACTQEITAPATVNKLGHDLKYTNKGNGTHDAECKRTGCDYVVTAEACADGDDADKECDKCHGVMPAVTGEVKVGANRARVEYDVDGETKCAWTFTPAETAMYKFTSTNEKVHVAAFEGFARSAYYDEDYKDKGFNFSFLLQAGTTYTLKCDMLDNSEGDFDFTVTKEDAPTATLAVENGKAADTDTVGVFNTWEEREKAIVYTSLTVVSEALYTVTVDETNEYLIKYFNGEVYFSETAEGIKADANKLAGENVDGEYVAEKALEKGKTYYLYGVLNKIKVDEQSEAEYYGSLTVSVEAKPGTTAATAIEVTPDEASDIVVPAGKTVYYKVKGKYEVKTESTTLKIDDVAVDANTVVGNFDMLEFKVIAITSTNGEGETANVTFKTLYKEGTQYNPIELTLDTPADVTLEWVTTVEGGASEPKYYSFAPETAGYYKVTIGGTDADKVRTSAFHIKEGETEKSEILNQNNLEYVVYIDPATANKNIVDKAGNLLLSIYPIRFEFGSTIVDDGWDISFTVTVTATTKPVEEEKPVDDGVALIVGTNEISEFTGENYEAKACLTQSDTVTAGTYHIKISKAYDGSITINGENKPYVTDWEGDVELTAGGKIIIDVCQNWNLDNVIIEITKK